MRLKSVKINKDYKIFKKDEEFIFNSNTLSINNSIDQKFNVLTGGNGSGKTLLMSTISTFFHNIDRFHNRTLFDIEVCYEIVYYKTPKEVKLSSKDGNYFITIKGEFENSKILPNEPDKAIGFVPVEGKLYNENNETHFVHIKSYLPKSIVLSTFSIHNEYPRNRPGRYRGERFLKVFDISKLYGPNHFELPTITRGISRFLNLIFNEGNSSIREAFNSLGFSFNNKVLVHDFDELSWVKVDHDNFRKLINQSESGEAYLNDLEFLRNEKEIHFSNMSTGEKMLVYRIISILAEIEDDSLVIVEEPEIHLDFSWNRQIISLFDAVFKKYNAHIVFISHNPYLINSLKQNQVLFLKNGVQQFIKGNTFHSSIDELFIAMFDDKFTLNISEQNIMERIEETKELATLTEIYNGLGNSIYKFLAFQKIKKIQGNVESKE